MTDEKPEVVTFSEAEAQEIIDTLHIMTCAVCGEPITAQTFGGVLAAGDGMVAFHNTVPCFLELMRQQEE